MSTFSASQRIGEIVAAMPMASEIFKAYGIDFCCGGHRSLSEALKELGLTEEAVLDKLEKARAELDISNSGADFREMASDELIDQIIHTHHVYLRKALPEISELAAMILRAHGSRHDELFKVHKLFHHLKTELEQHMIKEEEVLFPMMKQYGDNPSDVNLKRIRDIMGEAGDEHEGAGDLLKELRTVTHHFEAPQDGCTTYNTTYEKLRELEGDLFQHIHLENNILFHRFQ